MSTTKLPHRPILSVVREIGVAATLARAWFLMHVLRAKGPPVCLAQAIGLGRRMSKNSPGPTARPFAEIRCTELVRSCKRPGFQPSRQNAASIPRPLAWARQNAGPSARRAASELCKTTGVRNPRLCATARCAMLNERASMLIVARAWKIRRLATAATGQIGRLFLDRCLARLCLRPIRATARLPKLDSFAATLPKQDPSEAVPQTMTSYRSVAKFDSNATTSPKQDL